MITDFLLSFFSELIRSVLYFMPDGIGVPTVLENNLEAMAQIFATGASLGVWLPLDLAITCMFGLMNVALGGFFVKMGRVVLSTFTGGGGSA